MQVKHVLATMVSLITKVAFLIYSSENYILLCQRNSKQNLIYVLDRLTKIATNFFFENHQKLCTCNFERSALAEFCSINCQHAKLSIHIHIHINFFMIHKEVTHNI